MLQRIARFLQDLQTSSPELCRYDDWWEHDGLHFEKGPASFHDLFAMVATPRSIFETTPDDHEVSIGISPRDGAWYLRFRAGWDAEDQVIIGCFALILPTELAAAFRAEVGPALACDLSEEPSEAYYQRIVA